jgi:hypothetical protein
MLLVNEENITAFENALETANCAICLVSISTTLIHTKRGTLTDDRLDGEFNVAYRLRSTTYQVDWSESCPPRMRRKI